MIRSLLDAVLVDADALVRGADPSMVADRLGVGLPPDAVREVVELAALVPVAVLSGGIVVTGADLGAEPHTVHVPHPRSAPVPSGKGRKGVDRAAVLLAVGRLGVEDLDRVLLVGDGPSDEAAALAAGVRWCAPAGTDRLAATVRSWVASRAGTELTAARSALRPPDGVAAAAAAELHDRLTKPRGSLGRLESLGCLLAGLSGACPPPAPHPATVVVFAGDHGVLAEGVSPWPQEVTAQMVANLCTGGAAINVLARQHGADVVVVDVGVATPPSPHPSLLARNVARGTANLATGPAMTVIEARLALDVGAEVARRAVASGARCIVTGDMGIGSTTPSAAVIAALTARDAAEVTGRGTGVDDATLVRKVAVVAAAVARTAGMTAEEVLAEVGGLEIGAIAGFVVGGAAAGVPVVVDGVIALAGAVLAEALSPGVRAWCVAGHRSVEPGASVALDHLGLEPLLDLGLRLGEGTGAVLALPLLHSATRVLAEMATFDGAGVTDKPG